MSKPLADELQEHVLKAIVSAPADVIEEYKLQFLGMPTEVSRLDFFHASNREEWVNAKRYCDFIRHKLLWSGDHMFGYDMAVSPQGFRQIGLRSPQTGLKHYPTWRDAVLNGSEPVQPSKEVIVISSDDDEEAIDKIIQRLRRRKKAKEVISISSDSDEPLVETILPRKRKAGPSGESSQGARKKHTKIRIFDPEVISVLDSDEEMTVVG
ncbi:hypothetical protein BJ912DRAFT_932624 [Pholiota molesta]|nr:hypothetical protein BJ912DRAFT_932624 [Pholiota molesta]